MDDLPDWDDDGEEPGPSGPREEDTGPSGPREADAGTSGPREVVEESGPSGPRDPPSSWPSDKMWAERSSQGRALRGEPDKHGSSRGHPRIFVGGRWRRATSEEAARIGRGPARGLAGAAFILLGIHPQ